MKNPCRDNCLVVAACTELCNEKINYGILVEGGSQRYQEYLRNPNIRFIQRTKSMYKYYHDRTLQHNSDVSKITKRSRGLL